MHKATNEPDGTPRLVYRTESPTKKWAWAGICKPAEPHSPWNACHSLLLTWEVLHSPYRSGSWALQCYQISIYNYVSNDAEQWWMHVKCSAYLNALKPVAGVVLSCASVTGCFGFTFQLALVQDLLSMMTLHIYCFYVYAVRWLILCWCSVPACYKIAVVF